MHAVVIEYIEDGIIGAQIVDSSAKRPKIIDGASRTGVKTITLPAQSIPDHVGLHKVAYNHVRLIDEEKLWSRKHEKSKLGKIPLDLKPAPIPRRRVPGITYLLSISDAGYWPNLRKHLIENNLPELGEKGLILHDATDKGLKEARTFLAVLEGFDRVEYVRDSRGPCIGYKNGQRPVQHTPEMILRTYELYGEMADRTLTEYILTWEQDVGPQKDTACKLLDIMAKREKCACISAAVPHPREDGKAFAWKCASMAPIRSPEALRMQKGGIGGVDVVTFSFGLFRASFLDQVAWVSSGRIGSDFWLCQQWASLGYEVLVDWESPVKHRVEKSPIM